jgi:uncharacterized protein (DUF1800 family)
MSQSDTVTALRRFGLGPKPGEMQKIAGDPRGALLASITDKTAGRLDQPELDPSHVVYAMAQEAQMAQRLAQALMKDALKPETMRDVPAVPAGAPMQPQAPPQMTPQSPMPGQPAPAAGVAAGNRPNQIRRDALVDELAARIERGVTTDRAFVERLVLFWSNHFCVSSAKGPVRGLAGGYEREAIRPHVLGRFADMLRAVEQHPAMLIYLDNQVSTGPNSKAGRNRTRGLNENLARETLELHTLGVAGGYSQDDVTNLARILTGWTVGQVNVERSEPGKFFFAANRHEPGEWTVMGKRYPDEGQRSAERVLDDLARHPSTAKHIAGKLARHFVSDKPPAALVAALEKSFRDSDGDLAVVARTLLTSPESWALPPTKIVPPYDFTISLVRGLNLQQQKPGEIVRLAGLLGQPVWQPPSPKGWPDDDDAWMGPSAIRERLRIAERLARDVDRTIDPRVAASDLLGPGLSEQTRQAIARAEAREQGLELLVMSPEFLRR